MESGLVLVLGLATLAVAAVVLALFTDAVVGLFSPVLPSAANAKAAEECQHHVLVLPLAAGSLPLVVVVGAAGSLPLVVVVGDAGNLPLAVEMGAPGSLPLAVEIGAPGSLPIAL
ncbi:UNVERIFIED_CONTAM: hypothetical protein FKN15_056480 [Acipenser sinensis]